jgi:hypothetical protein
MHANSLAAYHSLNISERAQAVLKVYVESSTPLTDREVMRRMNFSDPNQVRPRATELVDAGLLEEAGDTIDKETGKRVRLCRPAGRALEMKPVDPQKALRRQLCAQVAKMDDQGQTIGDLRRTFPEVKAVDIENAVGVCWAHGALEKRPHVQRQGETVYFLTPGGRELLAKTAAQ